MLELFEKLKRDPRHYEVNKWIQGYLEKRIFTKWSMASWMLSNKELEQMDALSEIRGFLKDPKRANFPPGRFIEMIRNLLETWILHENQRAEKKNSK